MLGQADLERAVVGPKDVPGWDTGTLVGRGGDGLRIGQSIPDVSRFPKPRPAACGPLNSAAGMVGDRQYHALVEQTVSRSSAKDPEGEQTVTMSLTAYSAADAPRVMADLRTSLRTCTSFRTPLEPDMGYSDPRPLAEPKLGDDAVSYRITQSNPSVDRSGNDDGGPRVDAHFHYVVVRCGTGIAVFSAMAFPQDTRPPQVPMDLVAAQVDKLRKVVTGR
ncbi:hypothetical protein [Actinacidiphila yanglinensis]|uniref:hypothetical protein n=1 Tax=Actinacidiphila yanglinensis TaxID=310779 RepID=UPI000CDE9529|nr:hypothetical protein [Actinacidiphila yanglinensis]